jgi:hypothetical protein
VPKTRARKRVLLSVVAAASVIAAGLPFAVPASASTLPWEPDPNALGSVTFYDGAGNVLTGGTNVNHIADYAAASTPAPAGSAYTQADLMFANPASGQATGSWMTGSGSSNTAFPSSFAPAPITGPAFSNPLVTLTAIDGDLGAFVSSSPANTAAGYVDIYQVRIYATGSGGASTSPKYWETDIQLNRDPQTQAVVGWSVATSTGSTATTTSISATPPGPQMAPAQPVTLSSTVTPGASGTIQFFDGTSDVGGPQTVSASSPTATVTTAAPAVGTHLYQADFTPAQGTSVQGSDSTILDYQVGTTGPTTQVALAVNPGTVPQGGTVTFTADVSESDAPTTAGLAGSVQFAVNGATVGTVTGNDGTVGEYQLTYTVTQPASSQEYGVIATFTPSDTTYAGSSSTMVPMLVTASQGCTGPSASCPGDPDTQNIQVELPAGALTITTPYTATNPFVLPQMTLSADGSMLTSTAVFPAPADPQIVVTSSLAGDPNWSVTVTDSDLSTGSTPPSVINGQNLGLTGGTLVLSSPPFPGTVTFTDNPAANGVAAGAPGSLGLKGGPHTFAQSSGGGNGSAQMFGTLTLNAPTTTGAGTYTGMITFTVS